MGSGFERNFRPPIAPTNDRPKPDPTPTMTQGEYAKSMGYTGDFCQTCGSVRMKMAGHCMVCEECGSTTGCS